MEPVRFDILVRSFSIPGTRRATLGVLLAGAGIAFGWDGRQRAAAQGCAANGTRCSDGTECCSGRCRRNRHRGRKTCRQAPQQGVCTVEQNLCTFSVADCGTNSTGGDCFCFVTSTGRSFCGETYVPESCGCTSDKQCESQLPNGKGARCVNAQGGVGCSACTTTVCAPPCSDPDPVP